MKRIFSLLLVITMLFSYTSFSVFADSTSESEFLLNLQDVEDEEAFIDLISQNLWTIQDLQQYTYYDSVKTRVAYLFIINSVDYSLLENFQSDFEAYVLLSRIYCAEESDDLEFIIPEFDGLVDLTGYNKLKTSVQKTYVWGNIYGSRDSIETLGYFKQLLDRFVSKAQSLGGGGSAGGSGGNVSDTFEPYFNLNIVNEEYDFFDSTPADGTKVKITVDLNNVELNTQYVIAVYEKEDDVPILRAMQLYKSTASDFDEIETLEMDTTYDADGIIKIINISNTFYWNPARGAAVFDFSIKE